MSTPTEPIVTVESVLELMSRLTPRQRLQVIRRVLPQLEDAIPEASPTPPAARPLRSLRGLWKGSANISEEDIDEMRREAWQGFEEKWQF